MKILGVDVVGVKLALGQNNGGKFTGVILLDLRDESLVVTFNPTGPDFTYYHEPGVVELHRTNNLRVNKVSMNELKAHIAAHILSMRDSGLEPNEYTHEYYWNNRFMDEL